MAETHAVHREETNGEAPACAYILGDPREAGWRVCGQPRLPGSAYCATHHARCHLRRGSAAEAARLLQVEALAAAVGGRSGSARRLPPGRFVDRLERLLHDFL